METGQSFLFGSFRLSPARRELWGDGVPLTLGSRALDILLALVRRRGELATKKELMDEVWGAGISVEENNLTTHIATLRRALGDGGNGGRFILTVPGRGYRFVAPVQLIADGAISSAAPPPTPITAPVNIPLPLTSLVGRTKETREIIARLERSRLVTITGAGGVGKTRLAIEAAASLTGRFPDGVYLLEFAPIGDPTLVTETVARHLNISLPPGSDATKLIIAALKSAKVALVLDNCEHLIEAISDLIAAILPACPSVAIIATSRERLRIGGESTYQLLPLEIPPPSIAATPDILAENPSVQLFVDRAATALDGFDLTAENALSIATICRRLDGIPFAIELAVPWLRILPPARLASKLDDRFRVLTRGDRGTVPHHQTLSSLIGWSYDLLTAAERSALDRLSIFPATFSADAAIAAIGPEIGDENECFTALAALVDKSLVLIQPSGVEQRYRLLETTWAFAQEKLGPAGKLEVLARIAPYIAAIFAEAEASWPTTATSVWRARYEPELEILRSVLVWAFGEAGDTALGVRLVTSANWFWEELGLVAERSRWLNIACDAICETTPPEIVGKIRLGLNFAGTIGHGGDAALLREPVEIFRKLQEPIYLALALRQLAAITMRAGEVAEAEQWLAEAEALLRPLGPSKPLCGVLDIRSTARLFAGDAAGCRTLLEQTLAQARELDYPRQIEVATMNLAELEFDEGNLALAIRYLEDTIVSCLASGNLRFLCGARTNLAGYALAAGEVDRALLHAREGLRLSVGIQDRFLGLCCIEHLALIAARLGHSALAQNLAGFGDAQYAMLGISRYGVEAATRNAINALLPNDGSDSPRGAEIVGPTSNFDLAVEVALNF